MRTIPGSLWHIAGIPVPAYAPREDAARNSPTDERPLDNDGERRQHAAQAETGGQSKEGWIHHRFPGANPRNARNLHEPTASATDADAAARRRNAQLAETGPVPQAVPLVARCNRGRKMY